MKNVFLPRNKTDPKKDIRGFRHVFSSVKVGACNVESYILLQCVIKKQTKTKLFPAHTKEHRGIRADGKP